MYNGLKKAVFPGISLIAWFLLQCESRKFVLNDKKMFARTLYTLKTIFSSKNSSNVLSYIYIT